RQWPEVALRLRIVGTMAIIDGLSATWMVTATSIGMIEDRCANVDIVTTARVTTRAIGDVIAIMVSMATASMVTTVSTVTMANMVITASMATTATIRMNVIVATSRA